VGGLLTKTETQHQMKMIINAIFSQAASDQTDYETFGTLSATAIVKQFFLLDCNVSDVIFRFYFRFRVCDLGRDRDPGGQVATEFLLRFPVDVVAIKNLSKKNFEKSLFVFFTFIYLSHRF
jgi:hypothetical protein